MSKLSVDDISIIEIWHGHIALLSKDKILNLFYTPKEANMVLKHLSPYGDKMDAYTRALFCAIERGVQMLESYNKSRAGADE